jgi:predicted phosphodiesterase
VFQCRLASRREILTETTMSAFRQIQAERLFAVSDLHVDFARNRDWVAGLDPGDYQDSVLLLAGDVSHRLERIRETFAVLKAIFKEVFFVPGNHDLWVTGDHADSLEKLRCLEEACREAGVLRQPGLVDSGNSVVQVVPLDSWYHEPEDSGDTLFIGRDGDELWRDAWADYRRIRWPASPIKGGIFEYMAESNRGRNRHAEHVPVVTFSHFLPRRELLRGRTTRPDSRTSEPRHGFNFSRVAGSRAIDRNLRSLHSSVHVYGHQHRNRDRLINGVRYVSHCLGYPAERDRSHIVDLEQGPIPIWDATGGVRTQSQRIDGNGTE